MFTRGVDRGGRGLPFRDEMAHGIECLEVEGPAPVVDGAEVGALPVGHARVLLDVTHVKGLQESVDMPITRLNFSVIQNPTNSLSSEYMKLKTNNVKCDRLVFN